MLMYAIALLVLGLVLAFLEALIPSGGLLGVLATLAIVGSLVLAFTESQTTGFVFLTVTVVLVPVLIVVGLKMLPHTPVGRRMILRPAADGAGRHPQVAGVAERDYSVLLDKRGVTVTALRPSGIVEIDNERYSAVAQGEMIDSGVKITVVAIEGNSIVVDDQGG